MSSCVDPGRFAKRPYSHTSLRLVSAAPAPRTTKAGYTNPAFALSLASRVLRWSNVLRLHSLTPLGRLVRYLGALVEGLEALACYARVVHEEVLTPVVRGDEAVALLVAEPLYRSLGHMPEPTFRVPGLH